MKRKIFLENIAGIVKPTLIEVQAKWSGESHLMDFILEEIEEQFIEKLIIKRIDFDEHEEWLNQLGIKCPPVFVFIKNGQVMEIVNEVLPKKSLVKKIYELLSF